MDLVKIGKYIAGKRKALNLTQKQLAEKLNMSDKSVSKWERGVCLPDVSVYMDLCEILHISINEFLAGEDISQENIITKADDNLLQVSKDNKHKIKNLKSIILALVIVALAAISTLGTIFFRHLNQPKNYIMPIARDSAEMKTAELISGVNGAFLFRYYTHDDFKTLTIYISEYQHGKLIEKNKMTLFDDALPSTSGGMIALVPDFDTSTVKLIVTADSGKYATDLPILSDVDSVYFGKSATQIEEISPIRYNTEQGLLGLIYSKEYLSVLPIQQMESGNTGSVNDYVYYFSLQFEK